MLSGSFGISKAISKGGSWLLATALDVIDSIPQSISFFILLFLLVAVFVGFIIFAGKIKWIIRRYF